MFLQMYENILPAVDAIFSVGYTDAVGLNYINYSLVIINYISKLIIFIGLNRMHLGICT